MGPATVLTNADGGRVLHDAGIVCEDGKIQWIGDFSSIRLGAQAVRMIDTEGRVVMPGLINAHQHLYSTFARGMPIAAGTELANFPQVLEGIWWRLDRALDIAAVEAGAYPPLLDGLRWGCTTIMDHHASPNAIRGSLEALGNVCSSLGVRASLAYEITDRNGVAGADEGIGENGAFIKACSARTEALIAMIGLHASFTLSDETLAKVRDRLPADCPVHVHVAEDVADKVLSEERYGRTILDRLDAYGLLRRNSLLIHGVHLDESELRRIASTGAFLVHNPESNANNAVGHLDVLRAMELGVNVALGTDGMASNMLRAAKSAYLMIRHQRRDPRVGMSLPRLLLLEANARLAQSAFGEPGLGTISVGAPADLCVVDYVPPTPLNESTLDAHLTFGITEAPIFATVSAGALRFERGHFPNVDMAGVAEQIRVASSRVWQRLG